MKLEDLRSGQLVDGVLPDTTVRIRALEVFGGGARSIVFEMPDGRLSEKVVFRSDATRFSLSKSSFRSFTAAPNDFKLAAEAGRIRRAGKYDPLIAISASEIDPYPHQISAVYGSMLPKHPLRFLLADDPGAGKTIMAGLLIKELMLREDVRRCLIVAPGGLVDQWQDELKSKFGMSFSVLSTGAGVEEACQALAETDFLIARMDQLARNEILFSALGDSPWDLIVVDEAHRMMPHWFGNKLQKSRRYHLGKQLGTQTRHFLLMTATPHNGKEDDFQSFLGLLDPDAFEGRAEPHELVNQDLSHVMRRMVKEQLLTFEGKSLFPERIAETVTYCLSQKEQELYEQVTDYVSQEMGRAEQIANGKQRRTVGFALTILQRRLASSPAAIHESLKRRLEKLQTRLDEVRKGQSKLDKWIDAFDSAQLDELDDEFAPQQGELWEIELANEATASRTEEEFLIEIAQLESLADSAKKVRESKTDVKWAQLRSIINEEVLRANNGSPRKLIVFTEHKDTLDYLAVQIRRVIGRPNAVVEIHGGVNRSDRRTRASEFTNNPECVVLLATDAAGEGLNLQAAHLMVNYDLPWNPNRLEQRFGRIHRIGQTEVCRLWNLVAETTREGQVFRTLLGKIEQQSLALDGRVFNVLGEDSFSEIPLRDLLIEAIRYGDSSEVVAKRNQVIDKEVSTGLEHLQKQKLSRDVLTPDEIGALKKQMETAKARKLQPHYIQAAFLECFRRLGGTARRRKGGRFELRYVPEVIRKKRTQISSRYEAVTFSYDSENSSDDQANQTEVLAPGHPLHDAVFELTEQQLMGSLRAGATFISNKISDPQVLVGIAEEIVDGNNEIISQRFTYLGVDESLSVTPAGFAPYLDLQGAPEGAITDSARSIRWLEKAEKAVRKWAVQYSLPLYRDSVQRERGLELDNIQSAVETRLTSEIRRLSAEANQARVKALEDPAYQVRVNETMAKARDLQDRLSDRRHQISLQRSLTTPPPRIATSALVLPARWFKEAPRPDQLPPSTGAKNTREVERRGVNKVLAVETALGRTPEEMPVNNPGFDIQSVGDSDVLLFIEVKARIAGSRDFFITHNELVTAKNLGESYRLALVSVDPESPDRDEVRYLTNPFEKTVVKDLFISKYSLKWDDYWRRAGAPV